MKMIRIVILLCLAAFALANIAVAAIRPTSPFDLVWDQEQIDLSAGSSFQLTLTLRVPEGHYLYVDELDVEFTSLEGLFVTDIRYPKGVPYHDPYLERTIDVYRGDVAITIEGRVPEGLEEGKRELVADVMFRGCSPKICFRPEIREVAFDIDVVPPSVEEGPAPFAAISPSQGDAGEAKVLGFGGLLKVQDFGVLLQRGWALTILIVFIAGILTSLTPCVWPVIPVVLLFVGVHPHKRFWENFLLAATLVAGLVLVYAVLGVIIVAFGKNLGFLFQHRIFLALVVLFFIVMSLSMFGVFDVRMPKRWQHRLHQLGGEGYRGAFLAGMATGLVASPCSGPVLAALLGYAALQRSYVAGFALLIVYGVGMGLFFIILGAAYGELVGKIKSGAWMVWIRRALGVLLLFPAAFYMGSLFDWGGGEGVFAPKDRPQIEWLTSERDALKFAATTGRPVMIEFTAEWCPPCQALERRFFNRSDIVQLSYKLVPLKIDATVETKEVRRIVHRYRVVGWPTVVFLDPQGRRYNDLRVNDYEPDLIEKGMHEAIRRTDGTEPKDEGRKD